MKKLIVLIYVFLFFSCKEEQNTNVYLPNTTVNIYINLSLPRNNNLLIAGGFIMTSRAVEAGIEGLIILNTGTGFLAFDRACPHIPLQSCSVMTVDYPFMVCPCDDEKFSILDGFPQNSNIQQSARNYNVTQNGNMLHITN